MTCSPHSDSPRIRRCSLIFAGIAAAVVCGCDSGEPFHDQHPLAPYDEHDDAVARCEVFDAPPRSEAPTCDPSARETGEPTYSLCACAGIDARNTVTSHSSAGHSDDVGTNGGWVSSSPIDIARALTSSASLRADNTLTVDGLFVDDMLIGSSDVHVRGDAVIGGMEFPQQRVTIDGTLTVPADAALDGLVSAVDIVRDDVEVVAPCDCAAADEDLVAFADFHDESDDPHALVGLTEPETLYFGCGDHELSAIEAANVLTIVIVGDARIWVDGDVEVAGPFAIEIEDGASLELFVGGRFAPTNTVTMGNPSDPDALRVYVDEHVQLASPWDLAGSLYAPHADVIVSNTLELRGAIFGNRFELSSPVSLRDGPRFSADACVLGE